MHWCDQKSRATGLQAAIEYLCWFALCLYAWNLQNECRGSLQNGILLTVELCSFRIKLHPAYSTQLQCKGWKVGNWKSNHLVFITLSPFKYCWCTDGLFGTCAPKTDYTNPQNVNVISTAVFFVRWLRGCALIWYPRNLIGKFERTWTVNL